MIAFLITGLIRRSATGWRTPPAEQPEPRAVARHEDARTSRAVRLEAVEAAQVPEERPGDRGADREGADEHDDARRGDLQPQLQAPCTRVAISHSDAG